MCGGIDAVDLWVVSWGTWPTARCLWWYSVRKTTRAKTTSRDIFGTTFRRFCKFLILVNYKKLGRVLTRSSDGTPSRPSQP